MSNCLITKFTHTYICSRSGALNLLKDFDGVSEWIIANSDVPTEYCDILAKHEVLRMCEGVGKILLRRPYEIISMGSSVPLLRNAQGIPAYRNFENKILLMKLNCIFIIDDMDEKAPLPPEMFVPNQQRWLELRARNRKNFNPLSCLCGSVSM